MSSTNTNQQAAIRFLIIDWRVIVKDDLLSEMGKQNS